MLTMFHPRPNELAPFKDGPLAPHLEGFALHLVRQRYSRCNGLLKLRLAAELSRWLSQQRVRLDSLGEEQTARFLRERWKQRPRRSGDRTTMKLVLQYLREGRMIPEARPPVARSSRDRLLAAYEQFLLQERGLAPGTVVLYRGLARRFLEHRFPEGRVVPAQLRAADIVKYVLHESALGGRGHLQSTACMLRSLLGFLLEHGRIAKPLAGAVPTTTVGRSSSEPPRYLQVAQVERLLKCCDRRRSVGRRDFAMLLLMARLGLRVGEVVRLRLDDIDWDAGLLLIRGKGARLDRMPLPEDVGQAIACYLKGRRSCSTSRHVFLGCKAPYKSFTSGGSVSGLVSRALTRAGIERRHRGGHVLRHSLATRMLRDGASMSEIGQILRHRQAQSTEIYAKVDLNALRTLAQPWPGGGQ